MKLIIQDILQKKLNDKVVSIKEITGLGSVNHVYNIEGEAQNYILRLNNEPEKRIEYLKEKWCIEKAASLGIPSPEVLTIGFHNNTSFMLQDKIEGLNGEKCKDTQQTSIWRKLGEYAANFHQVQRIEVNEVEESEFHDSWKARLIYNINELNEKDSLLKKNILSLTEQKKGRNILASFQNKELRVGLVHGDLCPRNTIFNGEQVYLLDWGTADINVVPHNEIGIVQMTKKVTQKDFKAFLEGLGISKSAFKKIEEEIRVLNFLHRLDKYRWAEGHLHLVDDINEYEEDVRSTFEKLVI